MKRVMLLAGVLAACLCASCQTTPNSSLQVPAGCVAKSGTVAEPYTKSGWAKEVVHEKTGIELVYVPAGKFVMGFPPPEEVGWFYTETMHQVTITKGFYLGKYEVRQDQWVRVMRTNPSVFSYKSTDLPVENVSWNDSVDFCRAGGNNLRLPTEAEWEYACRAGSTGVFGGTGDLDEMGWYYGNSSKHSTHPVGQKHPNAWGFYDMHGNVNEWCSDWYGVYPTKHVTDPTGATTGSCRIFRGGSWGMYFGRYCRSPARFSQEPNTHDSNTGFRVVLPTTN